MGSRNYLSAILAVLVLLGLYLTTLHSYLLFHSLAEIFSIAVAFGIFMLAWASRRFLVDTFFLFIGIAFLFIGALDLIHTLSYRGMGVFPSSDADLPTQLWIGARYMEGLSFLVAPFVIGRRWKARFVFLGYGLASFFLLASIFYWKIFPGCFVEGMGLTPFKKVSEYLISFLLLAAVAVMLKKRNEFDPNVLRLLVASILLTVVSELAFTFYVHAYGLSNLIGHYFKIGAFYLIYKAIIDTGLSKPYDLLFRNLKKNEETLEKERDFISAVLSTAGALVVVLDREGRIFRFNRACEDLTGYSFDEVRGKHVSDLFLIPEEMERVRAIFAELRAGQFPNHLENHWVGKDGTRYLIAWSNTALLGEGGLVEYVIGTGLDVTEQRKTEEELKWELTLNAALAELYKPLVSPSSRIEEIAHLVLEKARDLTRSLHGFVSSIDPLTGDNVCHTLTEMLNDRRMIRERQRKVVFPRGKDGVYPSLWGYSLNTKQAFFTNSPEDHQASKGLPDGHIPVTRFLSVPVLLGNEVVGQIALANKDMDYHERDLEAIRRLAGHYALAIQRIRAQEEIRKSRDQLEIRVRERTTELAKAIHQLRGEIEERMRVERALKESERKYSTLVEESLTGVYIEQDGKIEFANERFAEVYGYSREEIIGLENWKLVFPEDRDLVREIRQRRLSGQEAPSEYEARGLTREGKTIWVVRRNKVIQYRQRPAILGNVVDITGRKEMEVALLRSEKELRLLSSQLLSAEEKERKRIARELHDGIGQLLSAIKFGLENTLNQMEGRVEKSASESFQDLIRLIQKATEEVRRIVMDLRPSTLDDLGILPTINWFCREFQTIYSGIAVEKEIAIQERDVPEEVKTAIYRVLQEAFNNIAKHSRTDWVGLSLTKKEGRLDLAIRDHGVGFHPGDTVSGERSRGGFGLASMRERTELSGGIFSIESAEGDGTLVRASWPAEECRDESGRE